MFVPSGTSVCPEPHFFNSHHWKWYAGLEVRKSKEQDPAGASTDTMTERIHPSFVIHNKEEESGL